MNKLIIGAKGQLGKRLAKEFPDAKTVDVSELDITNKKSVIDFDWSDIDVIINAAAYTNVDGAETNEGRSAAWKVNAEAVKNLTHVSWQHDLTLVHISTDYVFDGSQKEHMENEAFSPLSTYGSSKAAGDLLVSQLDKHYILRTSWVIGDGGNFVKTMLELGKKGVNPTVVSDQVGRLTFTSEVVRAIKHLLDEKAEFGTYNVTNSGEPASWADITREIFKIAGYDNTVTDTTTEEYSKGKQYAKRPLNSTLDLDKITATGFEPKDWKEDLKTYIKESR
ncbi:MAG: NAD(P)-dependent oxidoreductase [bacterium]|nr:NAD(P)-dependent oxidoreductase [bacterium]